HEIRRQAEYKYKSRRLGMSVGDLDAVTALGAKGKASGGKFRLTRAVHSRNQLVEKLLAHRGLYLYLMGRQQSGHAVGFDTRNNEIHFFDPNWGYFYSETIPPVADLQTFIHGVWDSPATPYKQWYHGGCRYL